MKNKYFNDAIIGNQNVTASYSKTGELLRLYFPSPDYMQFIRQFDTGVKINDSRIIYLHDDINNKYEQFYTEDTNILNTNIENTYFKLKIEQTDSVMIDKDVMLKKYVFRNNNAIDLDVKFLIHSQVFSSHNNMAGALIEDQTLIQYSHNYILTIFSDKDLLGHKLHNLEEAIGAGVLKDKDYIGMTNSAAISYDIGVIKPGQKKELNIYVYASHEKENVNELGNQINKLRKIDINKENTEIKKYWKKFVKDHDKLNLEKYKKEYGDRIEKVYKRTILYLPLLINEKTGGISASVEVDEETDNCGRYSYCWPRDAIFILQAMDLLGLSEETKKFYEVFAKKTQSKNGMWEQRFYTDGRLAPCWGYQIDETASIIYGAYQHYSILEKYKGKPDKKFLKDNLKMFENAVGFLEKYLDHILGKEEEKVDVVRKEIEATYNYEQRQEIYKRPSYDLWEMTEGIHLYSLSTIYGAFTSMIKIYSEIKDTYTNNRLKLDKILDTETKMEKYMTRIKKYIKENLSDKEKSILLRNNVDEKIDISMLGVVYPFEVFKPKEKVVLNTIEQINMTLRTYTGGYLRFQDDGYMGGGYPWVIATAWMGLYYKRVGDKEKVKECINYILNSCNEHGFLPEQVDNDAMQPKWVMGLGWSHAMLVLLLES